MPTLQEIIEKNNIQVQPRAASTSLDALAKRAGVEPIKKDLTFVERAKERFVGAAERVTPKIVKAAESVQEGKSSKLRGGFRAAGQLLSGGSEVVFGTLLDAAVPQPLAKKVKKEVDKLLNTPKGKKGAELLSEYVEGVSDRYEQYKLENPEKSQDLEAVVGFLELYGGRKAAGEAFSRTEDVVETGTKSLLRKADEGVTATRQAIEPIKERAAGVTQKAKEVGERFPRAIERAGESLEESKLRAERIKTSRPEVAQAIKSNLDERVIDAVETADDATKQAQKEMVKLADSSKKTLGLARRPEYVAGEAAAKQYKVINENRKSIGKELESATRELSKTTSADISQELAQLENVLSQQGVRFTEKGIDFTGSNFTRAQRAKVKELYELATEVGDTMTPYQIYKRDQLFSQLQREARFSDIGDILIDTQEGKKSLFSLFRDVYSSKLDTFSPEIKDINSRYSEARRLVDDIESTIAKTGKLDVTKDIDLAEVAQTRLRRLSSDAQSAAEYRAVVEKMDNAARQLGYDGANPAELSDFAIALRDIYPTAVPKTSATAILGRPRIVDLLSKAMEVGAPNAADQQKALKALLGIK